MSEPQYVFTMHRLDKVHPPDKVILKEVSLSFIYGAKIGVLGVNGAGKITLLRIMAGIETSSAATARAGARAPRVGLLEQEPLLDRGQGRAREHRAGRWRDQLALTARYDEIGAKFAEPMDADEMQDAPRRASDVQDEIERANAWDTRPQGRDRHGRAALPAGRCRRRPRSRAARSGGWRCAGCC